MITIFADTLDEAYTDGLGTLVALGETETSQRGSVLVMDCPVTTIYGRPNYRVLFNERRDANPFFHLVESVWMLAGERDARFLDQYVKNFSSRFGEANGEIHGAYGYRWRNHFDVDQIPVVGEMLYTSPSTRRAVLTMWDPNFDLNVEKNDIPCNTQIFFRVRDDLTRGTHDTDGTKTPVLDMMVSNRSNDAIWGAYGANAVHMSILQEVMAGLAGVQLGTYNQVSFNFHAYSDILEKSIPLTQTQYQGEPSPLIRGGSPAALRADAANLLAGAKQVISTHGMEPIGHHWLDGTVIPMMYVHRLWKDGQKVLARDALENIQSTDWREAARLWMNRRSK